MKTCKQCGEEKDESEFYLYGRMCKICVRARVKERTDRLNATDPDWRVKELQRQRKKSALARANGTASPTDPESSKRWRARNPEKYKAHCALNNAIRDGRIQRQKCHCGKKAQAHHNNYSKPLDVIWLCSEHHMAHHAKLNEIEILS